MTIVTQDEQRHHIPAPPVSSIWHVIHRLYAKSDTQRWRALAMLTLQESGWSLSQIGRVFVHHKGHVSRTIATVKTEVQRECKYQAIVTDNQGD